MNILNCLGYRCKMFVYSEADMIGKFANSILVIMLSYPSFLFLRSFSFPQNLKYFMNSS